MTREMTAGRPAPLILAFALPLLLGNLLQQFYSLTDAALVGRYLGTYALAGVGASSSVLFLILGFCVGLAGGMGIPISQAFGARDYDKMRTYVYNSFWVVGAVSLILTVVCCWLCGDILHGMNTPDEIYRDAYTYLIVIFLSIPVNLGLNLLLSVIRSLGDSKAPFYILLATSVLNILGDLFLILLCGMGVEGAALATAASMLAGCGMALYHIRRNLGVLHGVSRCPFSWHHVGVLLGMGVPMGLQFSITAIGSIMLQSANNALGTICATAFTTAMRIKMFFVCPFENLGLAMATYCGQNRGASRAASDPGKALELHNRIWSGIRAALGMMLIYALFTLVVLWPWADSITTLFVGPEETEVIRHSELFLHISASCYIFIGILTIFRYSLQGIGFTKLSMLSGVSELIARALISILLVPALGFLGVCLGDPTAWVAADLFLVPAFYLVMRAIRRSLPAESVAE